MFVVTDGIDGDGTDIPRSDTHGEGGGMLTLKKFVVYRPRNAWSLTYEGRARIYWKASARITERDTGRVCAGQDSGYVTVSVELNIVFQVGKAAQPSASTPGMYWLQNAPSGERGFRQLRMDCPPPMADEYPTVDPAWISSSSTSGEGARTRWGMRVLTGCKNHRPNGVITTCAGIATKSDGATVRWRLNGTKLATPKQAG